MKTYRRFPADPARWFSADEVGKAKAYQRPLTVLNVVSTGVNLAFILVVISTEAAPRLADALGADGWLLRLAFVLGGLLLASKLLDLPFSAWQTFSHDRKWEFSTEKPGGWALDHVKSLVLGFVINGVLLYALWWLIRTTGLWWVFGWAVFLVFAVLLAFLAPIVLMPLFNKFTPLEDEDLAGRLVGLARSVGMNVSGVQVMDASKRTRKDNAFFAGLGRTRRIVLFDNMLGQPVAGIESVVAHEIGHWRLRHIPRMVAVATVTSFVLFGVLRLVSTWDLALDWAGVETIEDPVSLPLVILTFVAGNSVLGLVQSWLSRAHERQADLQALEITNDRDAFIEMMRGLATRNLVDMAPSWWKYARLSHPPPAERMSFATAWQGGDGSDRPPAAAEPGGHGS